MKSNEYLSILCVWILSVFIWNLNLSAGVSSRIEGVVTDKETGKAIPNALVLLYQDDDEFRATHTDNNGYFKFDLVFILKEFVNKYFYHVRCKAKGYIPFLPDYYFEEMKDEYFNEVYHAFKIKEGQIKHIKISLEKGSTLKGIINKKDESGTSPLKNATLFLLKKKKPHQNFFEDNKRLLVKSTRINEKGEFLFEELEPSDDIVVDEYMMKIKKRGYPDHFIKDIMIKKSEENFLEYTVDFTDPTGVKGKATMNGSPPREGFVQLYPESLNAMGEYEVISGDIDKNGSYFFKCIPPGLYTLRVVCYYALGKYEEEERLIEIVRGQSKVMNFNFIVEK